MITKIEIKTIDIQDCKYDIELLNVLTKELQNDQIVAYFLKPNAITIYYVTKTDAGISIESNGTFHHIDDIYNEFLKDFPNIVLETIKVGDTSNKEIDNSYSEKEIESIGIIVREKCEKRQEQHAKKDDYIEHGKKVKLDKIEVKGGVIFIFEDDGEIILLQDKYKLDYCRDSFDENDGTVLIVRTDILQNDMLDLNSAFDEVNKSFNTQIESAIKHNDSVTQVTWAPQIEEIMKAFDDIENDRPVAKTNIVHEVDNKTDHEINTEKMKELLSGLSEIGANFETMSEAVKLDVYGNSITFKTCADINVNSEYEIEINTPGKSVTDEILGSKPVAKLTGKSTDDSNEEYLAKMAPIADTITETINYKVSLISFSEFDNYAAKHNVVGWDLNSPTTLMIKYIDDGVTSDEKIEKFHDMMDHLSPAWIQKDCNNVNFYKDFHKVYDRDMVGEFMSRVTKHNKFVSESTAKIRTALLDMERDFESLKNEVNLTIDWDNLTAFATKKERIDHRSRGVNIVLGKEEANVVKITAKFQSEEFYLPIHLLNDDIRQKYTYDDELLRIEDVPDFAFYEVLVNGYVMIIEKTDL